jgi:thioredoxin-related protein
MDEFNSKNNTDVLIMFTVNWCDDCKKLIKESKNFMESIKPISNIRFGVLDLEMNEV